jgi:hypothetical protein
MSRAYKSKIGAWQPIETAPTNGDVFVVYVPHEMREAGGFQVMGYRRTDNGAIACMMSGDRLPKATHWMKQRENPTDEKAALKSAMAEQIHSLENRLVYTPAYQELISGAAFI